MKLVRVAMVVLIGTGLGTSCGDPNNEGDRGSVQATVRDADTHAPLAGAAVTVAGSSTVTGSDGFVVLEDLPAGSQSLSVTLAGYQSYGAQIEVPAGASLLLDIELLPALPGGSHPTGFRAIATNNPPNVIDLRWSEFPGATSYNIYWSTTSGVTPASGEKISVTAPAYSHTGLTPHTTYYYVVTAVTKLGESPPSAEAGATAGSGITIVGGLPPAGQVVNDLVFLGLEFVSTFQIVSVTAAVADRTTNLTLQPEQPGQRSRPWLGTVDLTGLPRGSYPLVLTAVDGQGNNAVTTVELLLDRPPTVSVVLPLDGTVAQGSVEVSATCTDDDPAGCLAIRAVLNDAILLVGTSSISGTISLPIGVDDILALQGVDQLSQTSLQQRKIFVEPNARLVPVSVGGSGFVLDADATRLLVFAPSEGNVMRVRDRVSNAETIVSTEAAQFGAALLDGGAVFSDSPGGLFLWRTGMLPIALSALFIDATTAGPYVAYGKQPGLERRNATTGGLVAVASGFTFGNVVVANGDVVYGTDGGLFRFTDPGTSTLDTEAGVLFIPLAADETRAVAVKQIAFNRFVLTLYDGAGETPLSGEESEGFDHFPAVVAGGWTAFSRLTSGLRQVWIRSAAGEERQLSFFSQPARVEDVSPAGDVLFVVPVQAGSEGRYLVRAGGAAELISRPHGRGFFLDGVPHVALGNTLFRVQ